MLREESYHCMDHNDWHTTSAKILCRCFQVPVVVEYNIIEAVKYSQMVIFSLLHQSVLGFYHTCPAAIRDSKESAIQ